MDEFSEKAWLVCKTVDIVDTNVNLHLSQQLTLVRGGLIPRVFIIPGNWSHKLVIVVRRVRSVAIQIFSFLDLCQPLDDPIEIQGNVLDALLTLLLLHDDHWAELPRAELGRLLLVKP